MSDETPGAGQSALPPREGNATPSSRPPTTTTTVRLAQVGGGQFVLATPSQVPALAQISGGGDQVTHIFSLSPRTSGQQPVSLRPSQTNQSIVKALTKPRPPTNVRLQLFPPGVAAIGSDGRVALKRTLSQSGEKRDTYAAKLQRVMNHRNVRSKIVREKYNEHLLENFHLESGGNILDLYQFAKRPKTQQFLAYLKENIIDPKEHTDDVGSTVPPTPTATAVSSLPGSSVAVTTIATSTPTPPAESPSSVTIKTIVATNNKVKTPIGYPPTTNNQEQIVEKAKQEAYVVQRITDLQKEGLWSEKRLPKVQEMPRIKAHWDFLLEEMVWLAADFAQERKWKKAAAKKCARMVQKYFQDKALAAQRAEKAHEQHIRRVAAFCAKEIKNFWSNVEKLVEYKQNTRLEEKRKKALDQHLSFIVDQTEKYSQLLAEGMNKPIVNNNETGNSDPVSRANSDDEFHPDSEISTDDEETIEQEEAVRDKEEQSEEVEALQRESQMDFEDFLSVSKDYLQNRDNIKLSDESENESSSTEQSDDKPSTSKTKASSKSNKSKDTDFEADSSSEDDEVTIQEQEKAEGKQDHKEEISQLNAEAELDIEELRKRYAEMPPVPDEDSNMSAGTEESKSEETEGDDGDDDESGNDSGRDSQMSVETEDDKDVGLKSLLDDSKEGEDTKTDNNDDLINDAAKIAESIQPKGNTLSSTSVVTIVPFLLKFPLREYQHIGLDWLVTMCERKLNGILADEMGLGKTIQTIALLAHLACEKENWGPHLIIVPTSVMLNWEMECKKWCPGFKILTYYGTQKERKLKRTGWTKPNAFHICITSYKLVIQDHQSFRRKKWRYLILDEAQNIKNFKSQRWQLLLNFQTQQRLLLTGTPLQNNLMELWSLMHFLMPNVFQSHREFKEWFSNPVTGMIEGNSEYNENIIKRLHKVLRPFLLRRLKCEVEKQMPKKYEHVVMCRLSKRQRFLYDDYMSRAKTRETLASGNLLSVINVLMQLRKVCNHPNLFEVRPTISPFHCEGILEHVPSLVYSAVQYDVWKHVDLVSMNLNLLHMEYNYSAYQCYRLRQYRVPRRLIEEIEPSEPFEVPPPCPPSRLSLKVHKGVNNAGRGIKVERQDGVVVGQTGQKVKLIQGTMKGAGGQTSSATVNLSSVLKPSVPGYAQLVQTSTGKHILLTPTGNVNPASIGITGTATVMTSSGQKLTVLSKQPVATTNTSTPQPSIAKAVVKVQLTSLPPPVTSDMSLADEKAEEMARKTVGTKFIDKLYSHTGHRSKGLDVRWQNSRSGGVSRVENEEKNEENKSEDEPENSETNRRIRLKILATVNHKRCSAMPIYGKDFISGMKTLFLETKKPWCGGITHCLDAQYNRYTEQVADSLRDIIYTPQRRIEEMTDIFNRFIVYVPAVHAPEPELQIWNPHPSMYWGRIEEKKMLVQKLLEPTTCLHQVASAMVTQFPHPRLIQYDCGKLQTLDRLLRTLKHGGHRALIFTQMTKMLDVLEAFLNFHGHIYLRLDGSTKIDQRQILMERFNGDARIFVFILSTRSGGVGVNLTGADTVIFYDSDWNPTMDAQAQDRCHRIGQTRDVHIYRLVSEMTIEENILKKANQKRLLGDLAIEGGNFTTAYFKSTTIQDLFTIDENEQSAETRMQEVVEMSRERESVRQEDTSPTPSTGEDKAAMGALENALAACEDDQDVIAARTAKAEAVADLAEFDENIPLEDQDKEKEPEISKAEQEVENLIKQLSPIERYAMRFIEETEAAWSAEHLAAAERQIEEQKREWEENRLAAMREEEERRARELEEENEILTFSREDATNQIWISESTNETMPMWCPPTPPQQDGDVYIDQTMSFLYDTTLMSETQLPPVYVRKEAKRSRHDAGLTESRRALKIHRKDDCTYPPKSLFDRPTSLAVKLKRDLQRQEKLQKMRGSLVRTASGTVATAGASGVPGVKLAAVPKQVPETPCLHGWTIYEDMSLLRVIQTFQGLNYNLESTGGRHGHTPNWDFVSDYVNTVSVTFRSPKQCRSRYENVLIPKEEGKHVIDTSPRKKKQKGTLYKFPIQPRSSRPMRTSQLYAQDNNATFSQLMKQRYDALKSFAVKKTTITKMVPSDIMAMKHALVLSEFGINIDHPMPAIEVAARRAERVAKERQNIPREQLLLQQKMLLQRSLGLLPGSPLSMTIAATLNAAQSSQTQQAAATTAAQVTVVQTAATATTTTSTATTPTTPPQGTLRVQRIVSSPNQTQTVVSASGLTPAQLQTATQRIIVSGTPGQSKSTVVGGAITSKTISPAQFHMIKQATLKHQQLRLQSGGVATQAVKTTTVTIAGQTAVQVQFTQAQARTQYVKPGMVTVTGKQGITKTVTESEMAQLLKRQHQLQQQKALAAAAAAGGSQAATVQAVSPQVFAQAIQAGTSGTQVATLVKAVSSAGVTQAVIGTPVKALPQGIKTTTAQQMRTLQFQQLLAQRKLQNQKIAGIAQVAGKSGVATQLIVNSKPISGAVNFQQVIRQPLNMPQPVVLTKGPQRVIPLNAGQGNKPTIQVVAGSSQGITTTLRPQASSTLAGALAGIKVPSGAQAQLISQVSAVLQGQNVRQGSPVRIQTTSGSPIVAVTVQSNAQASPQSADKQSADHVSRFVKK